MTEADFQNIESYVLGRMSQPDRVLFEQRLESDTEFREEHRIFMTLQRGIKLHARKALKSQVFTSGATTPVIPMYVRWIAAAAVLVLAIGTYWATRPTRYELLFQEYYAKADTIHFASPGVEDNQYKIKIDAYHAFKQSDHQEVDNQLNKLKQADPESELLTGLNKLHLGNYDEAMSSLLQAKTGSPKISRTASWYLALIYLKKNDEEKALLELKPLSASDSLYREPAIQLLKDLRE